MDDFKPELFKWYMARSDMDLVYRIFYKELAGKVFYLNVFVKINLIEQGEEFLRYMIHRGVDHKLVKNIPARFNDDVIKYIFEELI